MANKVNLALNLLSTMRANKYEVRYDLLAQATVNLHAVYVFNYIPFHTNILINTAD